MNKEQIQISIKDTEQRIEGLQSFNALTSSADIPNELKAQFKGVADKEIAFLEGILEDDSTAYLE